MPDVLSVHNGPQLQITAKLSPPEKTFCKSSCAFECGIKPQHSCY